MHLLIDWPREYERKRWPNHNTKIFSASRRNKSIASDTSEFKVHASSWKNSEIKRYQEEDWLREKHTPQTECRPSHKSRERTLKYGMVSFFQAGEFHGLMSERIIPIIVRDEVEISRNWAIANFWHFMVSLRTAKALVGVSFSLLI